MSWIRSQPIKSIGILLAEKQEFPEMSMMTTEAELPLIINPDRQRNEPQADFITSYVSRPSD